MIGKETEFGVVVTQRLISNIGQRIKELEKKEREYDIGRRLPQEN